MQFSYGSLVRVLYWGTNQCFTRALEEMEKELKVVLAKASCKNISREEVHALIDEIYGNYGGID